MYEKKENRKKPENVRQIIRKHIKDKYFKIVFWFTGIERPSGAQASTWRGEKTSETSTVQLSGEKKEDAK